MKVGASKYSRLRALMWFYLEEPVWLLETLRNLITSFALWAGSAAFCFGSAMVIAQIDDWGAGLCFMLCFVAGVLCLVPVIFFIGALATWLPAWWLATVVSRWQYSAILRTRGWPAILLTPRLVRFPAKAWRRLPDYEQIRSTGWCDEWWGGEIAPVNLYATLALLEELDLEWREGYDGRKTARELTDEAIGPRTRLS